MLLKAVRVAFIILAGAVAWYVAKVLNKAPVGECLMRSAVAAAAAAVMVGVDIAFRRHFLRSFVSVIFGIMLGTLVSGFLVVLVAVFLLPTLPAAETPGETYKSIMELIQPVVPLIFLATCYLTVSVVLRTKDEFRFMIPYVDFAEQSRTHGGMVLDSSVLIDGRIVDVAETLMLNDPLIVPHFVIDEMQGLADKPDRLLRARGRRGLDMVGRLQASPRLRVRIYDENVAGVEAVDAKLIRLSQVLGARLATNDFNLAKVAKIEKVEVVSINDLSAALRPPYLPGEEISLKIVRPGEEKGQGVGFLDDGTMVVVEDAREAVGSQIAAIVTSAIQTSAGRMIFGRRRGDEDSKEESGK